MPKNRNTRRSKTNRITSAEQLETRKLLSATSGSIDEWYQTRQRANGGRINSNLIDRSTEVSDSIRQSDEGSQSGTIEDLGIVTEISPAEIDAATANEGAFDVYVFETDTIGNTDAAIDLIFSHGQVDVDAYLFSADELLDDDSDHGLIASALSITDNESISLEGLAADTYVLMVQAYDGTGQYSGQIHLGGDNSDDIIFEEDFGILNGPIEHADNVNDENLHVFEFSLAETGTADSVLSASFDSETLDLDLMLFNTDIELVGESAGVTNSESISMNGLTAGDYLLVAYAYNGAGDYTLTLNHAVTQQPLPIQEVSGFVYAGRETNEVQVSSGQHISVTPVHSTTDSRDDLFGLGLRVHFDTRFFSYTGMGSASHGLEAAEQQADSQDLDNDANTDAFILILWIDYEGQWPGTTAPAELTPIQFQVGQDVADTRSSTINFTAHDSQTHDFHSEPINFEVRNYIRNVDEWYLNRQRANGGRVNSNLINRSTEISDSIRESDESRGGIVADLGLVTEIAPVEIDTTTVRSGTFDVYVFETETTGNADAAIDLLFDHAQVDVDAYLYAAEELLDDDSDDGLIASALSITDNESISLEGLAADTYVLMVQAYDGTGQYSGQIHLGGENSNDIIFEEDFGILNGSIDYTDSVHDENWHVFEFSLQESGRANSVVSASFDSNVLDLDLMLFDSDIELVGESAGLTGGESISMDGLAAGDYLLVAYAYDGAGDYLLSVNHAVEQQVSSLPVQEISGVAHTNIGRQADEAVVTSGELISVAPFYSTSDSRDDLNGLGLRVHFDSRFFNYSGMATNEIHGLVAAQQHADTANYDNNAATDAYISVLWADIQANWPGTSAPVELTPILFDVAPGLIEGTSSTINFTSYQTSPSHGFRSEPMTFEIGDSILTQSANLLDVDGDGEALPLTDGILMLRYFAGFNGITLVNGAVSSAATRTSPAEIEAFLSNATPQLDVDADGQAQPLTDGIVILRHMAGFSGNALVTGAVGSQGTRTAAGEIQSFLNSRTYQQTSNGTAAGSATMSFSDLDDDELIDSLFSSPGF